MGAFCEALLLLAGLCFLVFIDLTAHIGVPPATYQHVSFVLCFVPGPMTPPPAGTGTWHTCIGTVDIQRATCKVRFSLQTRSPLDDSNDSNNATTATTAAVTVTMTRKLEIIKYGL